MSEEPGEHIYGNYVTRTHQRVKREVHLVIITVVILNIIISIDLMIEIYTAYRFSRYNVNVKKGKNCLCLHARYSLIEFITTAYRACACVGLC